MNKLFYGVKLKVLTVILVFLLMGCQTWDTKTYAYSAMVVGGAGMAIAGLAIPGSTEPIKVIVPIGLLLACTGIYFLNY
jgi:hypothetical protein